MFHETGYELAGGSLECSNHAGFRANFLFNVCNCTSVPRLSSLSGLRKQFNPPRIAAWWVFFFCALGRGDQGRDRSQVPPESWGSTPESTP